MAISISFPFIGSDNANAHLRHLMANRPAQGVETLKSILTMWRAGNKEGMREYIGGVVDREFFGGRIMFTLTADGKQFRAWYGVPGTMSPSHVDSCGDGNFLTIYSTDKEEVQRIAKELVGDCWYQPVKVPNGTLIYGLWWTYR